jgi:hypothetical protein
MDCRTAGATRPSAVLRWGHIGAFTYVVADDSRKTPRARVRAALTGKAGRRIGQGVVRRGLPRRFGVGAGVPGARAEVRRNWPRPSCFASVERRSEYAGAVSGCVIFSFHRARYSPGDRPCAVVRWLRSIWPRHPHSRQTTKSRAYDRLMATAGLRTVGTSGSSPSSAKDRWTTAIRFGRSLAAMLLWET